MKFLIFSCNQDLDSIISMYVYSTLISNLGFNVQCYIDRKIDTKILNILNKYNVEFNCANNIDKSDNIIILNNQKIVIPSNACKENITEIISLKELNINKNEFVDANIRIENVSLLTTLIIESFREYNISIPKNCINLILELYNNFKLKLTDRDIITKDYLKLLCE